MSDPTLEQRLDRLEQENRRLKKAGVAALAVIAAVVLMGQATPTKGAKVVEMPDFFTWAFWNSPLVTTIIGAFLFTGFIALIAAVISHRLEKRRKVFDFQLDIFRTFSEKVSEFVNEFYELITMKDKLNHEDFKKAVDAVQYRHDRFALQFVSHVGPAFRDEEVSAQITKLHMHAIEKIFQVMTGPADWTLGTVDPLIGRYTRIWYIVMLRMRREMDLIGFDEYHETVWVIEKEMMKLEMTNN